MSDIRVRVECNELTRIADWLETIATILSKGSSNRETDNNTRLKDDDDLLQGKPDDPDKQSGPAVVRAVLDGIRDQLSFREGGGGADSGEIRAEQRARAEEQRRQEQLAREREAAMRRMEEDATKLCRSMGWKAYKKMMVRNARAAEVPVSKIEPLTSAEGVAAIVAASVAVALVIDAIRGCVREQEERDEQDADERRQADLERAYVRGMLRNAYECERIDREMHTA